MPAEEKTEAATHKKRQDERKKGNVFQSNDVINALSILVLFVMLKVTMPGIYEYFSGNLREFIGYCGTVDALTGEFAMKVLVTVILGIFSVGAPIMLSAMAVGIIASGAQTKFIFSFETLKFKFSKINPLSGFKKMFSMRTLVELLKSIIKAIIIGFIFYTEFSDILASSQNLIYMDVILAIGTILDRIFSIVIKLCIAFFIIAAADYFYQWWDHERNIRMTKQEVKEEYKHTEGDPQIKGRIKEMQRKRANMRMMQQVPTADVVVRNPTHFAVALKYDIERNGAPVVVAKGQDHLAFRIIEIANENNVPMVENKPLARALYKEVQIGREIPAEYYSATAEILAWVYSLKKRM